MRSSTTGRGGRSAHKHCAAGVGEDSRFLTADDCRQAKGREGSSCPLFALLAHRFPIEDCICWVSQGHGSKKKRQCNWWSAACGGQYNWRDPNRVLIIQDGTDASAAKVFGAHAPPQGACVLSNILANAWWTRSSRACRGRAGSKSRMCQGSPLKWTTRRR